MQKKKKKNLKDETRLRGDGDLQANVQESEMWPYYQRLYTQIRIRSGEWDA